MPIVDRSFLRIRRVPRLVNGHRDIEQLNFGDFSSFEGCRSTIRSRLGIHRGPSSPRLNVVETFFFSLSLYNLGWSGNEQSFTTPCHPRRVSPSLSICSCLNPFLVHFGSSADQPTRAARSGTRLNSHKVFHPPLPSPLSTIASTFFARRGRV